MQPEIRSETGAAPRVQGRLPEVVRVLVDHVELRRRAADVERKVDTSLEELHQLGKRLEDHIRHEERVLFPLIEEALPAAELAGLAEAVKHAEGAN